MKVSQVILIFRRGGIIRRIKLTSALLAAFFLFVSCSSGTTKNFQQLDQTVDGVKLSKIDSEITDEAAIEKKINGPEDSLAEDTSELDDIYADPKYRVFVLDFFTHQTGSAEIADLILRETEEHDLPVSLTFALAYVESRFDPYAVNYNKHSIDRGVFQLNNRSFPELREDQFFDPKVNVAHGIAYLKYCLERGENHVTALAMYNAGPRRVSEQGAPLMTLQYINKILKYREQLQQDFHSSMKVASLKVKPVKSEKNQTNVVDRNKLSK